MVGMAMRFGRLVRVLLAGAALTALAQSSSAEVVADDAASPHPAGAASASSTPTEPAGSASDSAARATSPAWGPAAPAPRFRSAVGAGITGGAGSGTYQYDSTTSANQSVANLTVDLVFDLGVQFNDHHALSLHSMAGTVVFFNHALTSAVYELTPRARFSLGVGLGYQAMATLVSVYGLGSSERHTWHGPVVPVTLGLNLPRYHRPVRRRALRVGLEVAPGVDAETGVFGVSGTVWVGTVRM